MTLICQALPAGFSDAFVYLPLCAAKLKQKLLCQPGLIHCHTISLQAWIFVIITISSSNKVKLQLHKSVSIWLLLFPWENYD